LIEALDIAPAAVFGTSAGAILGLDLVIRYPELVRGAILHEPPMITGMSSNPEQMMAATQQVVETDIQRGGPRGGVEAFWRIVAGDETFENLDSQLRERMLGNGETFFGTELGVFTSYRPTGRSDAEPRQDTRAGYGAHEGVLHSTRRQRGGSSIG
jgi:pimeloyl-ACP methyl ester carboxylesterase